MGFFIYTKIQVDMILLKGLIDIVNISFQLLSRWLHYFLNCSR